MNYFVRLATTLILSAFLSLTTLAQTNHKDFVQHVYDSVAALYIQTESGGMDMKCTATAYEKLADSSGYRFVSASHCVEGKTDKEQKAQKYYITLDESGEKTFYRAILIETGDKTIGDDFSIFEVKATKVFAISPLGNSSIVKVGDKVINISSPLGLGKQYFEGYVSNLHLDRPPLNAGEVKWTDVMLIEIGGGPGSSGSAIISEEQHAIVGFVVGTTGANVGLVILPADKFIAFEKAVKAGTYRKSKKSDENLGSGSDSAQQ